MDEDPSNELFRRVTGSKRKRLFGSRPIFRQFRAIDEAELAKLEADHEFEFPRDLRSWLLSYGFGDLDDEISLRAEWTSKVEQGDLQGHIIFAQDGLGNFYTFNPKDGATHYICRSAPEVGLVAGSFTEFVEELEKRDYRIYDWIEELAVRPCDWS